MNKLVSYVYHSSLSLKCDIYIHDKVKCLKMRKLIDIILIPFGMVKFMFLAISARLRNEGKYEYNLSVVCIVKNEATYISEWINYYISVGIDHFYIYDNDSTDNLRYVLSKYGDKVTYSKMSGKLRQLDAYNDALNKYRYVTKYMAVVDADEFIYCPLGNHKIFPLVNNILKNSYVGGLAINWLIFGSSGYADRPKGLVTDKFVYRANTNFSKNHHIKTIFNPRKVFYFSITHYPNYLPGYIAVDENLHRVSGAFSRNVSVKKIRINHYYCKSRQEYLLKRNRGAGDVLGKRNLDEFEEHDKNDILDKSIHDYNKVAGLH